MLNYPNLKKQKCRQDSTQTLDLDSDLITVSVTNDYFGNQTINRLF